MTRGNRLLGNFKLSGLKRAPRGMVQIAVTFEIDASGMVHVTARDLATGRAQDMVITAYGNLSRQEVERAVTDAQMYAAEDRVRKEVAACGMQRKRRSDGWENCGGGISRRRTGGSWTKRKKRLRRALKGRDAASIRQATESLSSEMNSLL